MLIIGVGLAWGDKKPDGVRFISCRSSQAQVVEYSYPKGDDTLLRHIASKTREQGDHVSLLLRV